MEATMWKKVEETEIWKTEKENEADTQREAVTQRLPGSMKTYSEAVDEFSKNTSEFLACIPLLIKAREAYQRAMAVSAEVRSMLDAGDGTLRTLMAQLEDAVAVHLGKNPSDRKKPESVKVEPAPAKNESHDSARSLPKESTQSGNSTH
jgi:hypothetical protein